MGGFHYAYGGFKGVRHLKTVLSSCSGMHMAFLVTTEGHWWSENVPHKCYSDALASHENSTGITLEDNGRQFEDFL
jgi:hypothetical protein